MKIRASIGSLAKLDLINLSSKFLPGTMYLLQYSEDGCLAGCTYCTQSRFSSVSKKFLSRITWYPVELEEIATVLSRQKTAFRRICVQTIIKKGFVEELYEIVRIMTNTLPESEISVTLTPVETSVLHKLADLGVDTVGVGLDASSPRIFNYVRKPYDWARYMSFIDSVLDVYGKATVHLIIGLGESLNELESTVRMLADKGCRVALFPFVEPSSMKPAVEIWYYRLAQILTYMVERGMSNSTEIQGFLEELIENIDKYANVFLTRGCPGCDRPYYTESPRGPFYNLYSTTHFSEYREKLLSELAYTKKMIERALS